jgi:hypothetical protein
MSVGDLDRFMSREGGLQLSSVRLGRRMFLSGRGYRKGNP